MPLTPAVLLRLLPRLASRDAEASKSEAAGAAVFVIRRKYDTSRNNRGKRIYRR